MEYRMTKEQRLFEDFIYFYSGILGIDYELIENRLIKMMNSKRLPVPKPTPITTPFTISGYVSSMVCIDDFGTLNPRALGYKTNKEEGNNPMYMSKDTPIDLQQKTYLNDRARNVFYSLIEKLNKQFFISDEDAPKTLADLKDRIANGKFIIGSDDGEMIGANDWDDEENKPSWNIYSAIRWRDPAKKADFKGKEAAVNELSKKHTATKDQIMIGTPADGLKALQDLEAWVPSNLPS